MLRFKRYTNNLLLAYERDPMNTPTPRYNRAAKQQLLETTQKYSQPQQEWRLHRIPFDLFANRTLMRELYKMGNNDPYQVRLLVQEGAQHVREASIWLRQQSPQQLQQTQNLSPNHPNVISNINHPLNPSNPTNLMLNPALNLLFQQDEATEAGILEEEGEQTAENGLAFELMRDETFQAAAKQGLTSFSADDPHKELNLSPDASPEQIETACLSQLAETAPAPGEEPSERHTKIAAAVMTLGCGHEELKHEKHFDFHHAADLASTVTAAPSA